MASMRLSEGFRGQKQWVLPQSSRERWSANPMLRGLLPTDIGWYPAAQYHYRERASGADEHLLIFCVDGSGWYEINGFKGTIKTNEALLIPRGLAHTYGSSEETPWSIHWVHFTGTEADFFVYHLPEDEYKLAVDPSCAATITELFKACYDSFVDGFVLHRLIYCGQILHHLLGCMFFNNAYFSPNQRSTRFRSIEPTLAFLQQNVHRALSLNEMADQAGLSASQFSFLFKQQTGYSPIDYFIHLKMQVAATMLSLTNKNIHEIAYEIGYADPYYFSRIFKKVMGAAPSHYRDSPSG